MVSLVVATALFVSACGGSSTADQSPPTGGSRPDWAASRQVELATATDRGRDWLIAQGSGLPPYVSLLMDQLRRRFGTEVPPEFEAAARAAAAGGEGAAQMRVYLRLLDPRVVITQADLDNLTDEVDRITGPALACDQVALPDGYLGLLQRAVELGGYERTHAVLALQWIREHGCIDEDAAAELSGRWTGELVETVESERVAGNGAGDLSIEAMAMLAYSGHIDRIEEGWVDDVLAAQNPDGSWPHGSTTMAASPHTTVLAVWLLLELADAEAAPIPWIPPSDGRSPSLN